MALAEALRFILSRYAIQYNEYGELQVVDGLSESKESKTAFMHVDEFTKGSETRQALEVIEQELEKLSESSFDSGE